MWTEDAKRRGLNVSTTILICMSSSVLLGCDSQVLMLNSGGHLGAVAALTGSTTVKIEKVILVSAPLDNTHTALWKHDDMAEHSPGLTQKAMSAFQDAFLAPDVDRREWRVSPVYADDDRLQRAKVCSWSIHVADLDFLKEDGFRFRDRLKAAGVPVKLRIYPGPHDILRLDLVLEGGRQVRRDISEEIRDSKNHGGAIGIPAGELCKGRPRILPVDKPRDVANGNSWNTPEVPG